MSSRNYQNLAEKYLPAACGLFLSLGLLSACSVDANETETSIEVVAEPMSVSSFRRGADTLSFGVISNGCTKASDFSLSLRPQKFGDAITLIRHTPDRCRRRSFTVEVKLEHASGKKVYLLNPVSPEQG